MAPKAPESDVIDDYLAQWKAVLPKLRTVAFAVSGRAARIAVYYQRLVAPILEEFELQQWEYDVLATLRRMDSERGATMSELTSQLLLASGSTTHRVDQLVKRKLVARRHDPENRRQVFVSLTVPGRALIDRVLPRLTDALAEPFSDFSPADWAAMERGQRLILAALEERVLPQFVERQNGAGAPDKATSRADKRVPKSSGSRHAKRGHLRSSPPDTRKER